MREKERWDELHTERKLHYPNEDVVRFVMRNWQTHREGLTALDLGCGSGRHLVYLAKEGFQVCGVDLSAVALANAEQFMQGAGVSGELKWASLDQIPYPDKYFDLVIAWEAVHYGNLEFGQRAGKEIYRVLKPLGRLFISLRNREDSHRGRESGEENTYLGVEYEEGLLIHRYSQEEALAILSDFEIVCVDRFLWTRNNQTQVNASFVIEAMRAV
jgi:SAM-dependent methyltransferase